MTDEQYEEEFVINSDSTLQQAAITLFTASEKAEMLNDVESLMKIAAGWMELHEYLTNTEREEKKHPLGFTGGLRDRDDRDTTDERDDDTEFIADQG